MAEQNSKQGWKNLLLVVAVIAAALCMNHYFEKRRERIRRNGPVTIIDTGNAQQNIRNAEAMREYLHDR